MWKCMEWTVLNVWNNKLWESCVCKLLYHLFDSLPWQPFAAMRLYTCNVFTTTLNWFFSSRHCELRQYLVYFGCRYLPSSLTTGLTFMISIFLYSFLLILLWLIVLEAVLDHQRMVGFSERILVRPWNK